MGEGCSGNHINERRDGFVTLDNLIEMADGLHKAIIDLANQRHPLSIYKGVKNLDESRNNHEILRASSKTYFFDIEKTQKGKPYLKITQSRYVKETKEHERNSIIIFKEDLFKFTGIYNAMAKRIADK